MGFHRDRILPTLCDRMMCNQMMRPYRERVVGAAEGRVLEIGAQMAHERAEKAGRTVSFIAASAEAIPLEDASVDTVVTTWTFCTIPHASAALAEMRRVLQPLRTATLRRTRPRARGRCCKVAEPPDPAMATHRRELPSQPGHPEFDRKRRLSRRCSGRRLCVRGAKDHDLPLRGQRATALTSKVAEKETP
jgi:hypothetical protein